ncbi:MAG TPA: hypothetical protein VGJ13_00540 [Pseudonocardiaceae bacterium]|jgi:hypothetical protein
MTTRAARAGHARGIASGSGSDPQPPEGADEPRKHRTDKPTRLSVNISNATASALREVTKDKEISMTEAVRRLIGYGIVVYRVVRDGGEVLIRRDDKAERLILLD